MFNVQNNKHKIILWLENNTPNEYNDKIATYAEIKEFHLQNEIISTFSKHISFYYNTSLSFYSDVVRYLLLYNYGGCWFDLDIFFLRRFDPIFYNFEKEICVYKWSNQNYPNGAIYISLEPKSDKLKYAIDFIIERNCGWGFQEANLTYDLPLELLVLPTSWFNADWISNPYNIGFHRFFENSDIHYDFDTFFKGAFCYHWHNQWDKPIHENSIVCQLISHLKIDSNS